jgi:hypothetical protein
MKYVISKFGNNIAVGLLDPNTAEEDINLSHNLFNTHVNRNYYNGVLAFTGIASFYRFLINKYMLQIYDTNKPFPQVLKLASNMTRSVINNETKFEDFMPQIYQYKKANKYRGPQIYQWHHPKYNSDKIED